MDYKELVERLNEWNENLISELCADDVLTCDDLCGCTGDCIVVQAATAITDLLARADAAEARVRELETSFRTEKCENGPECVELGRVRKALAEAEARAEKAERERDAAISVLQNLRDSALTAISEYEKKPKTEIWPEGGLTMERMTYDFCIGGNHCWQVKGADNLECREVCERQGDAGCKTCPIAKAFDRLATIEDILSDEYDLDRLRELVEADRDGRCVVLLSDDDVYTIRGDIVNGIIKANCRDACKPPMPR